MIPKINHRGHSFKGVTAYLMHDKDSSTSERVAWSETGNLHTNDIEKAALVMAYTDKNADLLKRDFSDSTAGRKANAGNVYHYSLSWAHTEKPEPDHQRNQALATLERLGLENHQYYMVAHSDTDHGHVHIVANLTHPETGKIHAPSFDKRALQAWALEYELEHGIHCKKREENAVKREHGENVKHQDTKQDYSDKITRAYYASDSGKAFVHALKEEGLQLAKARRGNSFVVVDEKGDIQKLARQLDIEAKGKLKTAAIKSKLSDIDREALKDADKLQHEIKEQSKPYDRDAEEIKQQKALADAAEKAAPKKAEAQDKELSTLKAEEASHAAYQKDIDQKSYASRKTWDINELTGKRDKAAAELAKVNGAWSRLFFEKKFNQAYDHHQDMEKRLTERLTRFRADIVEFNKTRPEGIQKRELEKHGFDLDERQVKIGQERAKIEVETQKAEKQNTLLKEADSNAEADKGLQDTATAKTQSQKAELSRVHHLANEQAGKEDIQKNQKQQKENEKSLTVENAVQQSEQEISGLSPEAVRIRDEFEEVRQEQTLKPQDQEQERGGWSDSQINKQESPEFENEEARRIWEEIEGQNYEQERDHGPEP